MTIATQLVPLRCGPRTSEERRVAVVGILGIVEESGLGPLATTDVGFSRKLADEPAIGCVNRNRLFLNVLALDQGFVSPLSQTTQVMIDVMLQMPVIPIEVTIECLHRCATTHHECMRTIDVVGSVDTVADLLGRMLGSVKVLTSEVS